jgi:NitT/TauT family transport system substrate-binding protein
VTSNSEVVALDPSCAGLSHASILKNRFAKKMDGRIKSGHGSRSGRSTGCVAVAIIATVLVAAPAAAEDEITYLLPAPASLPAFSPFMIAQHKGYYAAEGLKVRFVTGQGGADVATQVGAGNAELGGGIGDTPIIVRPNGVPVKSVAVLGGGALTQIIIRTDSGIKDIKGLKGKTVAVMSYQDTTFYSLLGTLANFGMTKADVKAQAVGPGGVVQLVVSGTAPALAGVPEWGVAIETAGVPVEWFPTREFFPGMAQAILASDATIAKRPKIVRGFVHGTLKALADIIADPAAATEAYVAAVPQNADKKDQMGKVIAQYAKLVYAGQKKLGEMDANQLAKLQEFYLKEQIIRRSTPAAELYTNDFIN